MAQKKMGRPPYGDKPMKERIFVLVSEETNAKLKECIEITHFTKSDIVRRGIDMVYDDLKK